MKKKLCALVVLLGLCWCLAGQAEEPQGRKLTLMVYMCGSNLESSYGSATADLQEMLTAGFPQDRVSLLVMTGGSKTQSTWFDTGETAIYEIATGRYRKVWSSNRMNMGRRETLTQLLCFGADRYPAENYALILWDHGGGPLEGVCWDELFSMDSLTLKELTEGLRMAEYPEKLSWIGFDACLMCSAEVAKAVSPYAEYMIASQETEPASGWDYAFLRGLETDQNGAETGRRIVDAYFDSMQDSPDLLTMACVDLSKIDGLLEKMDSFFNPLGSAVSEKTFADVSGVRRASSGFGQPVRATGETGYDLVDLRDLISRFGKDDTALQEALDEAVVVSRSNREGAGGLSVYHPYMNKTKYLDSWRKEYETLDFSAGYARYLDRFGSVLTGDELVDWGGLMTRDLGTDADGNHFFSLQLTDSQQEETVSVQLMILECPRPCSTAGGLSLAPVSVETAETDAAGEVSAAYRGRALYVMDEEGNVLTGPVSFLLSEDGEYYIVLTIYHDYSARTEKKDETAVLHYCRLNPQTNDLEIVRSYVYDWASETYTNRIAFTEEGFTNLHFRQFIRNMPGSANGTEPGAAIAGFDEWESYKGYLERAITLPARWHLHFSEDWEGTDLYAMFQVTDVRQNTWSSQPVSIGNPHETEVAVSPSRLEKEKFALRVSAVRKETRQYPAVTLTFEVENRSEEELNFHGTNFVLNGNRMTSEYLWSSYVKPGNRDTSIEYFREENLLGLTEVRTVDFTLEVSGKEYDAPKETFQVHLDLQDCDVASIASVPPAPLAEAHTEGAVWQLLSLVQESDGSFSGLLYVRNDMDEELNRDAELFMNGVRVEGTAAIRLYPHTERYFPFTAENGATVSQFRLHIADTHRLYHLGVPQALEQAGVRNVDRLELCLDLNDSQGRMGEKITFSLPETLTLQEPETVLEPRPLLEGDVSVNLESVLIADDGIGLGLRLRNDSEADVFLQTRRPAVNGTAFESFEPYSGILLPAHSSAVKCLVLRTGEEMRPGDSAEEMQFFFQLENALSDPVRLVFPQGSIFGAPGGTTLEAAALAEVIPAVFTEKLPALSETINIPEPEMQPIELTAPMTAEEAGKTERASVSLCLLDSETVVDPENGTREERVTRVLTASGLQRNEDGTWTALLSGMAVTVDGKPLRTNETRTGDQTWRMSPNDIFFYADEAQFQPTGSYGLFLDGGFRWYSDISFSVENDGGKAVTADRQMKLTPWDDYRETRTNCDLEEVVLAAAENRVFYGTNRMVNVYTVDYSEVYRISTEQPVTLTLVPAESLGKPLCLYYVFFYEDESRDDLIVDLKTGEILEKTHWAGEE